MNQKLSLVSPKHESAQKIAQRLDTQSREKVQRFKQAEYELIELLQQLDRRRGFCELGFASLYEYCTRGLRLSEGQDCALISVGRKAAELPQLQAALRAQRTTVSKIKAITKVLRRDNAEEWIEKAERMNRDELALEVARLSPQLMFSNRTERLSQKMLRVTLAMTDETHRNFERAQEVLGEENLEKTLERLVKSFLEKKDPVKKAERVMKKKKRALSSARDLDSTQLSSVQKAESSKTLSAVAEHSPGIWPIPPQLLSHPQLTASKSSKLSARTPLPAQLKHQVMLRDHGACQFRFTDGKACGRTRWIHLHHLLPVASGGRNDINNLVTLCSSHHRLMHFRADSSDENSPFSLSNPFVA